MTESTTTPAPRDRRAYALATKLFGSGVVAQACGFLATAFAATHTKPADFAIFAAVVAASAVLGSVNSLAAESRVPVVDRDTAESINRAGFSASVVFAVACGVLGAVGMKCGAAWGLVVALTSWCSFMLGLQHLLIGIILRTEQQELLAHNRLVQGISNAVMIVAFILLSMPGYLALSVAYALSFALSNVVLLRKIHGWSRGFRVARLADFRRLWAQVRWQPLSNVLIDTAGQIPLLALPALGAPAVSGAWALANRFLTPIINMAQTTLQPIYYGRAAALLRASDGSGFLRYQRMWSRRLALGSLAVVPIAFISLEWLIPMLGSEWRVASLVILPACIYFPMALSWLPISQTLIMSGYLGTQFAWTAQQFVLATAPFVLAAIGVLSPEQALVIWALVFAIGMAVHRVFQRREPRLHGTPASGSQLDGGD